MPAPAQRHRDRAHVDGPLAPQRHCPFVLAGPASPAPPRPPRRRVRTGSISASSTYGRWSWRARSAERHIRPDQPRPPAAGGSSRARHSTSPASFIAPNGPAVEDSPGDVARADPGRDQPGGDFVHGRRGQVELERARVSRQRHVQTLGDLRVERHVEPVEQPVDHHRGRRGGGSTRLTAPNRCSTRGGRAPSRAVAGRSRRTSAPSRDSPPRQKISRSASPTPAVVPGTSRSRPGSSANGLGHLELRPGRSPATAWTSSRRRPQPEAEHAAQRVAIRVDVAYQQHPAPVRPAC